jgi:hypothetical protein
MNPFTASPHELQALTDGEILDLAYEIVSDHNLSSGERLEILIRTLEDARG